MKSWVLQYNPQWVLQYYNSKFTKMVYVKYISEFWRNTVQMSVADTLEMLKKKPIKK